ncbi:MAG: flagellin lysine-N-methylase [Clostridia bacterium]|nr:flagellin lysine-N-methylase [Clostridia bacterium]
MKYALGDYDSFRCIAQACPDSCCVGWDVVIDDETAARYAAMDGALGEKLRAHLTVDDDGDRIFRLENGRCPFLCADGLCEIQREKGERALSVTCARFPRIVQEYTDFTEYCLSPACPPAAQILLRADRLHAPTPPTDDPALRELLVLRARWIARMQDRSAPFTQRLCACLRDAVRMSGYTAPDDGLSSPVALLDFLGNLDLMRDDFRELTASPRQTPCADARLLENLSVYYLYRYLLHAVSDGDVLLRLQLLCAAVTFAAFASGDPFDAARLFCKEVEHSYENMEAVCDACLSHPAFAPETFLKIWEETYETV